MSFTEGVVQDGFTRWYKAQTGYQAYIPNYREKPRTLEQFREEAAKREIGELLDTFCEGATLRGGRLSRNSINFNYRFRDLETRQLVTIRWTTCNTTSTVSPTSTPPSTATKVYSPSMVWSTAIWR